MFKIFIAVGLVVLNVISFLVVLYDKNAAIRGHNRVPERMLVLLAVFFCGIGELCAFYYIRHKTRHFRLLATVWFFSVLETAGFIWFFLSLDIRLTS